MTAIYIGVLIIAVGIFWIAYRSPEDAGDEALPPDLGGQNRINPHHQGTFSGTRDARAGVAATDELEGE